MKTIDFLVQELPKIGGWPDGAVVASFLCSKNTLSFANENGGCPSEWRFNMNNDVEDRCIEITRDQYEAALAAKNDGWIEWGGGECPVDARAIVDVMFRYQKTTSTHSAGCWRRDSNGTDSDIIAYRLHQPKEFAQTEAEQEEDLSECIVQEPVTTWGGEGLPPVGCECEYSLNGGSTWWKCKIDYIVGTQGVVMLCDTFEGVQYVQFSSYGDALKFRPIRSEADIKRHDAAQALCYAGGGIGKVDESAGIGSCWFDVYDAIAAGKIPGVKLED